MPTVTVTVTPRVRPSQALTVRRLIEVLTTMPGDALVVVTSPYGGVDPVVDVMEVGVRAQTPPPPDTSASVQSHGRFYVGRLGTGERPAVYVYGGVE